MVIKTEKNESDCKREVDKMHKKQQEKMGVSVQNRKE